MKRSKGEEAMGLCGLRHKRRIGPETGVRFRCVSKEWSSILRRRDFTDLHLKISLARRSLLFTFKLNGKLLFFSAPQPLNPDQVPYPLVADRYMSFDTGGCYSFNISQPVPSLLCSGDANPMVLNPSTGYYVTFPKVRSTFTGKKFLGYDPIDKLLRGVDVRKRRTIMEKTDQRSRNSQLRCTRWDMHRWSEDFKIVTRGNMVTLNTALINLKDFYHMTRECRLWNSAS
ncbi:unnamed protein product [Microthlaspi erraticum]|uniref:F-box associated beta-propeller type 3 domain-containing protein n=1 Tax=Microthlaspi erraticum TaxID=1685480 RepID=A0A6D2J6M9_9BRAS|nr:unnamed protein product [Microthlaspi erraticum]